MERLLSLNHQSKSPELKGEIHENVFLHQDLEAIRFFKREFYNPVPGHFMRPISYLGYLLGQNHWSFEERQEFSVELLPLFLEIFLASPDRRSPALPLLLKLEETQTISHFEKLEFEDAAKFSLLVELLPKASAEFIPLANHFEVRKKFREALPIVDLQSDQALYYWTQIHLYSQKLSEEERRFLLAMALRERDPLFPIGDRFRRWGESGEALVWEFIKAKSFVGRAGDLQVSAREMAKLEESLSTVLVGQPRSMSRSIRALGSPLYFATINRLDRLYADAGLLELWLSELNDALDRSTLETLERLDDKAATAFFLSILPAYSRFDWEALAISHPRLLVATKDFLLRFWEEESVSIGFEEVYLLLARRLIREDLSRALGLGFEEELAASIAEAAEVLTP
jgi:hypothetical protein